MSERKKERAKKTTMLMPEAALILGFGQTENRRSNNYPCPLFPQNGLAQLSKLLHASPIRKVLRNSQSGGFPVIYFIEDVFLLIESQNLEISASQLVKQYVLELDDKHAFRSNIPHCRTLVRRSRYIRSRYLFTETNVSQNIFRSN